MNTYTPVLMKSIAGFKNCLNDVIFLKNCEKPSKVLLYFGGDLQDVESQMLSKSTSSPYTKWSLEQSLRYIQRKFPNAFLFAISPNHFTRDGAAVFSNFVSFDWSSTSSYNITPASSKHKESQACMHLYHLLQSLSAKIRFDLLQPRHLIFIGFSKGCMVLNEMIREFSRSMDEESTTGVVMNSEAVDLVERIKEMYWLDPGHNGQNHYWPTDAFAIRTFFALTKNVFVGIHITPYQMCHKGPTWQKEESRFTETLTQLGHSFQRRFHFFTGNEEEKGVRASSRSGLLLNHFTVIEAFSDPSLAC